MFKVKRLNVDRFLAVRLNYDIMVKMPVLHMFIVFCILLKYGQKNHGPWTVKCTVHYFERYLDWQHGCQTFAVEKYGF